MYHFLRIKIKNYSIFANLIKFIIGIILLSNQQSIFQFFPLFSLCSLVSFLPLIKNSVQDHANKHHMTLVFIVEQLSSPFLFFYDVNMIEDHRQVIFRLLLSCVCHLLPPVTFCLCIIQPEYCRSVLLSSVPFTQRYIIYICSMNGDGNFNTWLS